MLWAKSVCVAWREIPAAEMTRKREMPNAMSVVAIAEKIKTEEGNKISRKAINPINKETVPRSKAINKGNRLINKAASLTNRRDQTNKQDQINRVTKINRAIPTSPVHNKAHQEGRSKMPELIKTVRNSKDPHSETNKTGRAVNRTDPINPGHKDHLDLREEILPHQQKTNLS